MERMLNHGHMVAVMAVWVDGKVVCIQVKVATEETEVRQAEEEEQAEQAVVVVATVAQEPEAKSESLVGR